MSWARETKLRLQFVAIFAAILCPAFLIWQASETRRQIASASWPSVRGEVEAISAKPWLDRDNNTKYYGRVTYRYVVEGKGYTTDLTDLGPGAKRLTRDAALADVSHFEPGMKITVYYDPADPGIGILENGIPTVDLVVLIVLSAGALVGLVMTFFTIRGWLRGLRQKRDEARFQRQSGSLTNVTAVPTQDAPVGERLQIFRPMRGNIVAGFIISSLSFVGGAAAIGVSLRAAYLAHWNLPFDVKNGWCWLAVGLFCLIGVVLIVIGVVLAAFSRGLISHRVEICQEGFRYCSRQSTEGVLWASVSRIRETTSYERPPLLKGPAKLLLPEIANASYTIVAISGKEYVFDGNSVKAIKQFGEVLREQAKRLSLPWEMVEEHS